VDIKTPSGSSISLSSDLTFVTNEQGKRLSDRFSVLLGSNTRFFDCLVGYFFISGFHKLHPALSKTEKIRILIGIQTDRTTYELIQTAKEHQQFALESHAHVYGMLLTRPAIRHRGLARRLVTPAWAPRAVRTSPLDSENDQAYVRTPFIFDK
jgi:hypothetical protein